MPDVLLPSPFEAYKGDKPYIFASYAHADGAEVFPELTYLHAKGYRIWFDEGINPGNEWPDEVAEALAGASHFLVFMSRNAVVSKNVRDEINYAINHQKQFLAVHIDEVELPPGLELRMGNNQGIMKYRLGPDSYKRKIEKALPPGLIGDAFESVELNFGKSEYLLLSHPDNVAAEPDMVVQIPALSEIWPIPEHIQRCYLDVRDATAEFRASGVVTFSLKRDEFDFTHELTIRWQDDRQEWVASVYRNWLENGAKHDEEYSGPYQLDDYCRGKLLESFKIREGVIARNLISTSDPERLRRIGEQFPIGDVLKAASEE